MNVRVLHKSIVSPVPATVLLVSNCILAETLNTWPPHFQEQSLKSAISSYKKKSQVSSTPPGISPYHIHLSWKHTVWLLCTLSNEGWFPDLQEFGASSLHPFWICGTTCDLVLNLQIEAVTEQFYFLCVWCWLLINFISHCIHKMFLMGSACVWRGMFYM